MSAAAGGGGAGWAGGLQDSLLATVLKCAKAKPKQAAAFLGYATAGADSALFHGIQWLLLVCSGMICSGPDAALN